MESKWYQKRPRASAGKKTDNVSESDLMCLIKYKQIIIEGFVCLLLRRGRDPTEPLAGGHL